MAAFDFQSGMQGAQAGASIGGPAAPYTAAAGFVIGGFVGGHKKATAKKKLKKKQRRYEKAYKELTGPAGYNKVVQGLLPGQRNLIAAGPGSQMQSNIATSLARGGYSGSGLGEASRAIGYIAPEVAALQQSNQQAFPIWQQQIQAFNDKAASEDIGWKGGNVPYAVNNPFGSASGAINMLGAYGSMMKGMGGGGTGSFASQYGNENFSNFVPSSTALGASQYQPMQNIAQPIDYNQIYNPNAGRSAIGSFGGY